MIKYFSGVTVEADGSLKSLDSDKLIPCLHGLASTGFTSALDSDEIELLDATTDRKVVIFRPHRFRISWIIFMTSSYSEFDQFWKKELKNTET